MNQLVTLALGQDCKKESQLEPTVVGFLHCGYACPRKWSGAIKHTLHNPPNSLNTVTVYSHYMTWAGWASCQRGGGFYKLLPMPLSNSNPHNVGKVEEFFTQASLSCHGSTCPPFTLLVLNLHFLGHGEGFRFRFKGI